MGHIGNTVQTAFTSFDKQTITGTGTSVYTLSHSVANEQEIEVFVNNVRQEGGSGKAYTVSGNQITFSENIASTDEVYVNFAGKAIQTASHPSTSPLQATTGTFSSSVDVGGSLLVDTIKEGTGTNTAMTIDSTGRILTPARPAFLAHRSSNGNVSYSASSNISADMTSTEFNVGGHYQTSGSDVGKFIAPITGYYFLGCNLFNNTTSGTRVNLYRESDGVAFAGQGQKSQSNDINLGSVVYLTANDKVFVRSNYASTIYHGSSHSYFYGYFIG